jgi:hypothetical protein
MRGAFDVTLFIKNEEVKNVKYKIGVSKFNSWKKRDLQFSTQRDIIRSIHSIEEIAQYTLICSSNC